MMTTYLLHLELLPSKIPRLGQRAMAVPTELKAQLLSIPVMIWRSLSALILRCNPWLDVPHTTKAVHQFGWNLTVLLWPALQSVATKQLGALMSESQSSSPPVNVGTEISFASNVQQETESYSMTRDVNGSTSLLDSLDKDQKQDHAMVKPPVDVFPYSDEWLAAMEAAGENILKMKSGAVENSPLERSEPEPSQWSPVRQKNNQAIGLFDCTKFINTNVSTNSP
ncbi:hypothetical protein MLD38_011625 [Melastoma candidum]|uniref:Uncharacterized protein n=1 Tax=Melastoma candidum TaxID=119954 RepID=A0ACB9R6N5_9MYRT|nr:hypothetical protein MLD38_011625 [Melastoma candidum]